MSVDRTCEMITSLNSLIDSDELEKWVGLALKLNPCGIENEVGSVRFSHYILATLVRMRD